MGTYRHIHRIEIEFDGDTVVADVGPLSVADGTRLMALDGQSAPGPEFAALSAAILPTYVKSFAGLRDASGADIPLATVCETAYFIPLVSQLFAKLLAVSLPSSEAA